MNTDVIEELVRYVTPHRWKRIQEVVAHRTYSIVPVLENIYDRGNTSAVMRSAEAFGFINFHVVERPEAKFKAANRVTKGTDKWLKVSKFTSSSNCLKALKEQGYQIYATHLEASVDIEEIDFTKKTAIILGNEKDGVSEEALHLSDGSFKVPMYGFAQSFNISVAAALCFYHIHRHRTLKMGQSGDLSEKEKQDLLEAYLRATLPSAEKILSRNMPG